MQLLELAELANLEVSGEHLIGLIMKIIPNDDDNATTTLNIPSSKNQGEAMFNVYWFHYVVFRRCLAVSRNHNMCVHFIPYMDPTEMQLFRVFFRVFHRWGVTT